MNDADTSRAVTAPPFSPVSLIPRGIVGGVLMGLANLVPGISGGTMLLASGIYPRFINAVAEVCRFRFHRTSLIVLGTVAVSALGAIVLFAGGVKSLVVEHRWVMYSLFIGLTLGGVPVVAALARPFGRAFVIGSLFGFAGMALLALAQTVGVGGGEGGEAGFGLMFVAGIAGAAAMILPGVSGGYLLLVLGVYVPILGGIDTVKRGLQAGDFGAIGDPMLDVVLPVGLGVVAGVAGVSNLLRYLLERFEKATLGVLMGLLVGAVVGLWPFQQGVAPQIGAMFRGRVITEQTLAKIEPEKYPTEFFTPTAMQSLSSIALIVAGFGATALLANIGNRKPAIRTAS